MNNRGIHLVLGALIALFVASCGGGGGSTTADGGIGGTGISRGAVTQFGSIYVNDRRFDVDSAEILVNGTAVLDERALARGYVVRVRGDLEDGRAESVRFDADLMGPVDDAASVDTDSTLTVMQQTVKLTAGTRLAGDIVEPADIANGDDVLVSGYRDAEGVLIARHLEVLDTLPPEDHQIVGRVTTTGDSQFSIGDLTVISAGARPDLGDRVLVAGTYDGTDFVASEVQDVEDLFEAGAPIELEGIVDEFTNMSSFSVDGVPVDATGVVPEGGTVGVNVTVEVEGTFDATGTLMAESVEIEDDTRIRGRVAGRDTTARTVSFFDTASGGPLVTAHVTDNTRMDVALSDLSSGDWVELEGSEDGAGDITALRLETGDPENRVRLRGIVDSVDAAVDAIVILGVEFDTSAAAIEDDNEQPIGLGDITAGDIVRVRWTDTGTATVTQPQPVEDVELEEDRTP